MLAAPPASGPQNLRRTVDTKNSTAPDDTIDAHYSGLERLELLERLKAPHGCMNGLVFIGHIIEEDGEEVEVFESVPCHRCADAVEVVEE